MKFKKAMMVGMYAGPFLLGVLIGIIVGAGALYFLYVKGTLSCPGLGK